MKKLIITLMFLSGALSASAAETIRFATEASYPPFEFIDADNTMRGFDVELAQTLCQQLHAECIFVNQAFDNLITGLKLRRFDAVISAIDITSERKKQVLFTEPYYQNSALFITRKGEISGIEALKGKRVGLQNGTTHQQFLQALHPEMAGIPYDSYQNAILDLKNGRLDAIFGDTAVINQWLEKDKTLAAVGHQITDADYFGNGFGIAVRHGNTALLSKLNRALEQLKRDGTYQKIYQQWFRTTPNNDE